MSRKDHGLQTCLTPTRPLRAVSPSSAECFWLGREDDILKLRVLNTCYAMPSSAHYEDASDSDEDEEECRVCRGPAEPG